MKEKMRKTWALELDDATATVLLYGSIADTTWYGDEVTPAIFRQELMDAVNAGAKEIAIRVNSYGGDAFAGLAMYNILKEVNVKKTAIIDGLAASAASLVVMAADEIIARPGTMMMIHEPWAASAGSADDMLALASELEKISHVYAEIYSERTGLTIETIRGMMKNETWMSAEEAVQYGFVDRVEGVSVQIAAEVRDGKFYAYGVEIPINVSKLISKEEQDNMDKELREIVAKISELQEQVQALSQIQNETPVQHATRVSAAGNAEHDYRRVFVDYLRGKAASDTVLNAAKTVYAEMTSLPDSAGVLIPPDVQTRIRELMRQYPDISRYFRQETVTLPAGYRVIEKFAAAQPMSPLDQPVSDLVTLPALEEPGFQAVNYTLKKYAGYILLSRELLNDTPENLLAYLTNWIAKKAIITRNAIAVNLLNTAKTAFSANVSTDNVFDKLYEAFVTKLDPALQTNAIFVTNQTGFSILSTLKDDMGRYLLQPDPAQPTTYRVMGREVVVVANRFLPDGSTTTGTAAPLFFGDFSEYATLFEYSGGYEVESTPYGGEAWRKYGYEVRVVMRLDAQVFDSDAVLKGELVVV